MPAYIAQPDTVLAPHKVTTAEIAEDIRDHHSQHPRLTAFLRVVANSGVDARYFAQPLDSPTIAGDAGIADRAVAAFGAALDMGQQAATAALARHGLAPDDIDGIITTHTTSWAVPNLDIHLVDRLGLRPTIARVALTTAACAGGVQALIRAVDMVTARPGSRVLVVAAEALSTIYNHADDNIEHMIYKALFGDSAAATIVSSAPLGPGLAVEGPGDTLEHILPGSLTHYSGRIDAGGLHFDSTKAALTAPGLALRTVVDWLGERIIDVPVIHPGSRPIIVSTAAALGLDEYDARHSLDTLTEEGNLGGVSVLRVLERTHEEPPHDGDRALMVAYGPGFATAALRATWHA